MAWQTFVLDDWRADLADDQRPPNAWSSLSNVVWRTGAARRPRADQNLLVGSSYAIQCFPRFAAAWNRTLGAEGGAIMLGNDATPAGKVIYWTGAAATACVDLTPAAWTTAGTVFTGGAFGGGFLVSKGTQNGLWVPPTTGSGTDLTVGPFQALRPFRYQALGIGGATYGYGTVRWSASTAAGTAPTTWIPAATNDAGDVDLIGTGAGLLVDGLQLGEDFIVYGSNSAHRLSYVGGTQVIEARQISHTGALWTGCVVDMGGAHAVLTDDDVVAFGLGGISGSLLAESDCRRAFLADLWANAAIGSRQARVYFSRARRQLLVGMAVDNSGAHQVIWARDMDTGRWGRYVRSSGSDRVLFEAAWVETGRPLDRNDLFAVQTGAESAVTSVVIKAFDPDTGGEDANTSTWTATGLGGVDNPQRLLCRAVRLRGQGPNVTDTLEVRIGAKDAADGAYNYGSWVGIGPTFSGQTGYLITGRYLAVQIRSAGGATTSSGLRVTGVELDLVPKGAW